MAAASFNTWTFALSEATDTPTPERRLAIRVAYGLAEIQPVRRSFRLLNNASLVVRPAIKNVLVGAAIEEVDARSADQNVAASTFLDF